MPAKGSKEGRKKSPLRTPKKRHSGTPRAGRGGVAERRVSQRERRAGSIFPKGDYETDVLIVGYGAAGANAARREKHPGERRKANERYAERVNSTPGMLNPERITPVARRGVGPG